MTPGHSQAAGQPAGETGEDARIIRTRADVARTAVLHAYPKAWTPGTNGPLKGPVMRVKIESEKERWLQARITGPSPGTWARPSTRGRKSAFSTGPRTTYLSSQ